MGGTAFSALFKHLSDVEEKRGPLDTPLLVQSGSLFASTHSRQDAVNFILVANRIMAVMEQDPTPLCDLLEKVLPLVHFYDIKDAIPLESVEQALCVPIKSLQSISLAYLRKASENPSGAARIGTNSSVVKQTISLWLSTESTEIAEKALGAICTLLSVDNPETRTVVEENGIIGEVAGQDLLWRRFFRDVDVVNLLLGWSSNKMRMMQQTHPNEQYYEFWAWSAKQSTIAQGRLFDFVAWTAALRWDVVSQAPWRNSSSLDQGLYPDSLLHYTTLGMIDETDELMIPVQNEFFTALLKIGRLPQSETTPEVSPALQFLLDHGKHERTLSYYLDNRYDSMTLMLLGGTHVRYLTTYLECYADHFLKSSLRQKICARVHTHLHLSRTQWAQGITPVDDLYVLAHMPGIAILRLEEAREALLCLPTSPANVVVLNSLARIFHGPMHDSYGASPSLQTDAECARTLYNTYVASHPDFWTNLAGTMNILAMPETALAAIDLVGSLVTAKWSGLAAMIHSGQQVVESLNTPVQASVLDAEASRIVWKVTSAKHDLIVEMLDLMDKGVGKDDVDQDSWNHTYYELRKERLQGTAPPPTVYAVNR